MSSNPYAPPNAVADEDAEARHQTQLLRRTGWLLFGTPWLVVLLIIVASIFSIMYLHDGWIGYLATELAIAIAAFFAVQYALGRTASLLGTSWVLYGVLTLLLIPISTLIAWLTLVDKRSKLKRAAAQQSPNEK